MDFRSDNTHGAHPGIVDALARASAGTTGSYGADALTTRVRERCRALFECDVEIFPVLTGTAGNALSIASMTPPWGAVFCHEDAHIQRDELGATEFFTNGAKLFPIAGDDGKLKASVLDRWIFAVGEERRMGTDGDGDRPSIFTRCGGKFITTNDLIRGTNVNDLLM